MYYALCCILYYVMYIPLLLVSFQALQVACLHSYICPSVYTYKRQIYTYQVHLVYNGIRRKV